MDYLENTDIKTKDFNEVIHLYDSTLSELGNMYGVTTEYVRESINKEICTLGFTVRSFRVAMSILDMFIAKKAEEESMMRLIRKSILRANYYLAYEGKGI